MSTASQYEYGTPSFSAQMGIARADITPPVGIYSRNWGAAEHDTAESIHRPLYLTALVIQPETGTPLIFVEGDLGWWRTLQTFKDFQASILERLSIDESQLIFSLTHTHASVPLVAVELELPGAEMLATYLSDVADKTVQIVEQAMNSLQPACLDWATGKCGLAKNRDLPDLENPEGKVVCGFNPLREPDDTLLVGRVTGQDGSVLATLVNYACHPTTLAWSNKAISPDYIGAMRETIEKETNGAPALFLQGASGDLAPREQYVDDLSIPDRHGAQLGFAALSTLQDMVPSSSSFKFERVVESGSPLAAWENQPAEPTTNCLSVLDSVEVPLKDWPSAAELEDQRAQSEDRVLSERLRRKRDIRLDLGDGETFGLPISLWKLGEVFIAGTMGEPYSQLQMELRARFPETTIVCLNLINGSSGYLPPRELYDIDIYQVWQTPFDRGTLELTIDRIAALIQQHLNE